MRLKSLREAAGFSQRQFAEIMGVSQPTITKWETGRAEMGAQRLQQASKVLHCTPDDILGIRRPKPTYLEPHPDWDADEACWGTLRLNLGEKPREFPISFSQRARIADLALAFEQESSWLEVVTLNNALLLLNLDQLDGFDLVTDDEKEAPFHMSGSAYEALTSAAEAVPQHLEEEVDQFHRLHSEEQEWTALRSIEIHHGSGRFIEAPLDADSAEAMSTIMIAPDEARFFEIPNTDGHFAHVISLRRVAFIKVPLAALTKHIGDRA